MIHLLASGMPAGTVLNLNANHRRFFNVTPFTSLQPSVTTETFDSDLVMNLTGTGILSGVNCSLTMTPVHAVVDANATQVGAPVQDFDANMRSLMGTLPNDTTCNLFASLTLVAGSDHGLPSPGHVHLVQRPDGTFDVNSHFDVNVNMSFVGKAGSVLAGCREPPLRSCAWGRRPTCRRRRRLPAASPGSLGAGDGRARGPADVGCDGLAAETRFVLTRPRTHPPAIAYPWVPCQRPRREDSRCTTTRRTR